MAAQVSLLRQYNVNRKEISEPDDQSYLENYLGLKVLRQTIWYGGQKKKESQLECLLFILKNVNLPHPVYVRQAAAEAINVARKPDRKEILAYLNGDTASCSAIDKSASLALPTRSAECDGLKS